MKKVKLFAIAYLTFISCSNSMENKTVNKDIFISKSGIKLPENSLNFHANEESAMNYFLYSRFELRKSDYEKFLQINNWSEKDIRQESPINLEVYNTRSEWWAPGKELLNKPHYFEFTNEKGKWQTSTIIAVDSLHNGNKVIYAFYSEEA